MPAGIRTCPSPKNAADGGLSSVRVVSTSSINATVLKSSPGRLHAAHLMNFSLSGSPIYLKLYNKATAPVVASDVPIMILPLTSIAPTVFDSALGVAFSVGIAYVMVTGAGNTNSTGIGADEVVGSLIYA